MGGTGSRGAEKEWEGKRNELRFNVLSLRGCEIWSSGQKA